MIPLQRIVAHLSSVSHDLLIVLNLSETKSDALPFVVTVARKPLEFQFGSSQDLVSWTDRIAGVHLRVCSKPNSFSLMTSMSADICHSMLTEISFQATSWQSGRAGEPDPFVRPS